MRLSSPHPVEAAREGTSQNVSLEYSVSNRREKTIGQTQINFFEQGGNAMSPEETTSSEHDVHYWSEGDRKMAWMREKRIKLFMEMELDNCRNELVWLIRCHNCAADNCPEKYPPRPQAILPDYIDNLQRRLERQ